MAPKAQAAHRAQAAQAVHLDCVVLKDQQDPQADHRAHKDHRAQLVHQVQLDKLVLVDQQEVHKVHKDLRAHKDQVFLYMMKVM